VHLDVASRIRPLLLHGHGVGRRVADEDRLRDRGRSRDLVVQDGVAENRACADEKQPPMTALRRIVSSFAKSCC
jgi:hypothetical protein